MSETAAKKVYIIGHKNPDTDSICSAIAYADLKNRAEDGLFIPLRAGQVNEETNYVLQYFQMEAPGFVPNIGTKVKDMYIRKIGGVASDITLKKAWLLMKNENVHTLPVTTESGDLEGIITIGDIAESCMDVYDNTLISRAQTPYKNIAETIDGSIILGDEESFISKGKVVIAAANLDFLENYIEENDLVIVGNRYESQLCAIEMGAHCIIACLGTPITKTIKKIAVERSCTIISTPYDTFTVARLINQSMPIKYFMKKSELLCFEPDDYTESIQDTMAKNRYRFFPILDKNKKYIGMVSRRDLLRIKKRQVILVDHNEASQAVYNIENADILEIIDHHRLGSLETDAPVIFRNQPVGCTATIIYQIYGEKNLKISKPIAGLLCAAIISDTLLFRSPTCTPIDRAAAEELAKIAEIDCEKFAEEMFTAGSNLKERSPEEIFYQDFKKFELNRTSFGVGQISSMNGTELQDVKTRLIPYMKKAFDRHGESMLFFMLTDIVNESTDLLCYGGNSVQLAKKAFQSEANENVLVLPGVVSRKKQLIPAFLNTLNR